jgi:hypothetical protein
VSASGRSATIPRVSVPGTLRQQLAASRRAGVDFEAAWPPAVRAAVTGVSLARERAAWREALTATQASWRAAYEDSPATRSERAVLVLADDDREVTGEVTTERACGHCGDSIPPERKRGARYCCQACQRAANGRVAA